MKTISPVLLIVLLLGTAQVHAQQTAYFNDGEGKPVYFTKVDYATEGSPFFMDAYTYCNVVLSNGTTYRDVKVKFNLQTNEVQYLDRSGKEMAVLLPVKKIAFTGAVPAVLTGFPGELNNAGGEIYQQLDSGKIQLLKKIRLSFHDESQYGQAGIKRIYDRREQLFVVDSKGNLQKLSKGRESLLAFMNDKAAQMKEYMNKENLSCKSEAEIMRAVMYYNQLQ